MKCPKCGEETYVEGILEGVSWFEKKPERTFLSVFSFSSGMYGIKSKACVACGCLYNFFLPKLPSGKKNSEVR